MTDVSAEIKRLSTADIRVGDAEKSRRTRPDGVALRGRPPTSAPGHGDRSSHF